MIPALSAPEAAMYALNFYSPLVADQLRSGRKSATIRLGDKAGKYKKGMVVMVLCGTRYSQRERVFDAVIDKVEVKRLGDLSRRARTTRPRGRSRSHMARGRSAPASLVHRAVAWSPRSLPHIRRGPVPAC